MTTPAPPSKAAPFDDRTSLSASYYGCRITESQLRGLLDLVAVDFAPDQLSIRAERNGRSSGRHTLDDLLAMMRSAPGADPAETPSELAAHAHDWHTGRSVSLGVRLHAVNLTVSAPDDTWASGRFRRISDALSAVGGTPQRPEHPAVSRTLGLLVGLGWPLLMGIAVIGGALAYPLVPAVVGPVAGLGWWWEEQRRRRRLAEHDEHLRTEVFYTPSPAVARGWASISSGERASLILSAISLTATITLGILALV